MTNTHQLVITEEILNRLKQLKSGSTVLVDYSYLGQVTPVIANYSSQPAVALTYLKQSGDSDLTGDRNPGDDYYGLDRFGRVQDQRWRKGTSDLERVQYGYDRASNRFWRQNLAGTTGQNEFYAYDGLYQIKSLARGTNFTVDSGQRTGISSPVWEEDWNYDPTGNWRGSSTAYLTKVSGATALDQNRSHNKANEITGITTASGTSWPSPTHDAAGNMLTVPRPLDPGNSFDLKWDAWNRPVEVKNSGGSVVAGYGYDGANRRITKVTGNDTRHFYYSDQWQVLEERLDSGSGPVLNRQFVWGIRSIDDLILRDRDTTGNGALNERLYALHDAMSVTAVVNTSGSVQERYGYDGFGQPRYMDGTFGSRGSSSFAWEILFDAYRYDIEIGLYQVRFRYLHPGLGRWINRDPIGEKGGKNLYRFGNNNPIKLIDRHGLRMPIACCVCLGALIAKFGGWVSGCLAGCPRGNPSYPYWTCVGDCVSDGFDERNIPPQNIQEEAGLASCILCGIKIEIKPECLEGTEKCDKVADSYIGGVRVCTFLCPQSGLEPFTGDFFCHQDYICRKLSATGG